MIASFLLAIEMALQFRIDVLFTKQVDQPFDSFLRFLRVLCVSGIEGARNRTIESASQTDEAGGMIRQLFSSDHTFLRLCVFRRVQFHEGDQATEIFVALSVFY